MAKYPPFVHGPRRFAVLRHSGIDEPHFDLMFETSADAPLETFRVTAWPPVDGVALPLRPHRRVYLDFEGEVPGRGRVDRVDEGEAQVTETPTGWTLDVGRAIGRVLIDQGDTDSAGAWSITVIR